MKLFTLNALIVAGVLSLGAQAADALSCSTSQVKFTLTQGSPDQALGATCVDSANDLNTINSSYSLFSLTGWTLGDSTGSSAGTGKVSFASAPTGGSTTWSILNPLGYTDLVVVIKQANVFGAFLLDASAALSGSWLTNGPGQSVGGLSHASVYYTGTPSAVPLPATGLLILGGMGALAAFRARRKSA